MIFLIINSVMRMKTSVKASYVGSRKQQIGSTFNLHKLSAKGMEAGRDDILVQRNLKDSKPWQPMAFKLADNVADGGFVDHGVFRHDWLSALARLMSLENLNMIFEQNRGIRHQPIGM